MTIIFERKFRLVCVCLALLITKTASVEARELDLRNAFVKLVVIGNEEIPPSSGNIASYVDFTLVDPVSDGCSGEHQFRFLLSTNSGNNEVDTSYGRSFLSLLLLAHANSLPLRVQYETDATSFAPMRQDPCNAGERTLSVVKWLGVDE